MAWSKSYICGLGGVHGAGQIYEKAFNIAEQEKRDVYWVIRVVSVFFFVTVAWVFFRAANIPEALYVLRHSLTGLSDFKTYLVKGVHTLGITRAVAYKVMLLYLAPLFVYDFFSLKGDVCEWFGKRHFTIRYGFVLTLIVAILTMGYAGQSTFVYFQF